MSKHLVIAEKPSVASDIAKSLGTCKKLDQFYENEAFIVSSAVGHLFELCAPEEYEVKKGKWKLDNLPVIPPFFTLRAIERTKSRLNVLLKLIKRKDVIGVINACDAGREGELIFSYIIQHAGTKKPVQRLWLQSLTKEAICEAFRSLRPGEQMKNLADAARCRAESDWLIGINGTRSITAFNSQNGGFQLTPVGRVKTPTLSIIVEKERKIRAHRPQAYWEISGTFVTDEANPATYTGQWFDQTMQHPQKDTHEHRERVWTLERAQSISAACVDQLATVAVEKKLSKQNAPYLFDLTSLQRECNRRFNFSARTTLSVAQALYEKHKNITYPRTDARFLPLDYVGVTKKVLTAFVKSNEEDIKHLFAPYAKTILDNRWVQEKNKKVFDNEKISDHFAIIPTIGPVKGMTEIETKLYDLIVRRFLAVFYPAAQYHITTYITSVGSFTFKSEGKILTEAGWKAVYEQEPDDPAEQLPPLQTGEVVRTSAVDITPCETKPPARFSEASLLSAMEGAGKLVEDSELRQAMANKGLGTPATRAAIIEDLLSEDYLIRQGKELWPTAKANSLITLLHGLSISELTSPEMTGEWECKLAQIERGQLDKSDFMDGIRSMAEKLATQTKSYQHNSVPGNFVTLSVPCPACAGVLKENYRAYHCQSCSFFLNKSISGRHFETQEIETLLTEGAVGPLNGFRSKLGRAFSARLLFQNHQITFDFSQNEQEGDFNFAESVPLGLCPRCGGRVFETNKQYLCENAVASVNTCTLRTAKNILKKEIEGAQFKKLLTERKTDLIDDFLSKKGRKFSAYLAFNDDNIIEFQFPKKEDRPNTCKKAVSKKSVLSVPKKSSPKKKSSTPP